ncbi:hypothetical protein DPMN_180271 [Dreissena polymorpha]|uniref:Uncharacterized protein n=1 Tax=Dreissena polymorpha TaxID=45954 RepID=A0A9D4EIP7_DREPO|nr:hypothetical protein DPMN_180271 [Dreissena polymorpha]
MGDNPGALDKKKKTNTKILVSASNERPRGNASTFIESSLVVFTWFVGAISAGLG